MREIRRATVAGASDRERPGEDGGLLVELPELEFGVESGRLGGLEGSAS